MKTHTARWFRAAPGVWLLKARTCDGGAVLATIRDAGADWLVEVGDDRLIRFSRHDAQRAARRALRKDVTP